MYTCGPGESQASDCYGNLILTDGGVKKDCGSARVWGREGGKRKGEGRWKCEVREGWKGGEEDGERRHVG